MFQADAIPDWAVLAVLTPFVPVAGLVGPVPGILQGLLLAASLVSHGIGSRRHPGRVSRPFQTVYLSGLLAPNLACVVWEILRDPAL